MFSRMTWTRTKPKPKPKPTKRTMLRQQGRLSTKLSTRKLVAQLLPSFDLIEQRVKARQGNRPLFEELFNRITGMDLKLAQYQQGEAFVDALVAARGVEFANRVWERPDNLPTMAEIRNPQLWIARMGG